jgi:hypothetical protein
MSTVLMTKGSEQISVDSAAVAAHELIGWKRAEIEYGKYELKIPRGDELNLERGSLQVNSVTNVLYQHYRCAPALGSATAVHADISLTTAVQTIILGITDPDVPRVLTIKANTTGMTKDVIIYGTNFHDELIQETFTMDGVSEVTGTLAFKTVTSIVVPIKTHSTGDKVSVGVADILGMPHFIDYASLLVYALFGGTADSGYDLDLDDNEIEKNLYTPAGTLDGSTLLDLYYMAENS